MADELPSVNLHSTLTMAERTPQTGVKSSGGDTREGAGEPADQEAEASSDDHHDGMTAEAPQCNSNQDWGLSSVRARARSSSQRSREEIFSSHARLSNSPTSSTPGGGRGWRRASLGMLEESQDMSALSVELAVADNAAPNSRIVSPPTRRGRSQSMVDARTAGTDPSGWGLPSRRGSSSSSSSAHPAPGFSQERSRRSMTQVEELEEVVERVRQHSTAADSVVKQGVIRPHRQHRSRPSIVDLFHLVVPAEEPEAAGLSPSSPGPAWRQHVNEAQVGFDPQGPTGSSSDQCDAGEGGAASSKRSKDGVRQEVEQQVSPAAHNSTSPGGRDAAALVAARARIKSPLTALFEETETDELHMAGDTSNNGGTHDAVASTNGAQTTEKLGFSQRFGKRFSMVTVRRPSSSPRSPSVAGVAWRVEHRDTAMVRQVRENRKRRQDCYYYKYHTVQSALNGDVLYCAYSTVLCAASNFSLCCSRASVIQY